MEHFILGERNRQKLACSCKIKQFKREHVFIGRVFICLVSNNSDDVTFIWILLAPTRTIITIGSVRKRRRKFPTLNIIPCPGSPGQVLRKWERRIRVTRLRCLADASLRYVLDFFKFTFFLFHERSHTVSLPAYKKQSQANSRYYFVSFLCILFYFY